MAYQFYNDTATIKLVENGQAKNLSKSLIALTVQGSDLVVIYHDAALTGASWVNVDATHSTMEYDVTASAITGGHIIQSEYVATSKNIKAAAKGLLGKAVLWHRQNGNTGILTVAAVRSDATNASTLVGIKWKEIR